MSKWLMAALVGVLMGVGNAHAASSFIEVNGLQMEYQLQGEGEPVLLLEAGGSAGLTDWEPIYDALSKEFRVLRYSRLGNGASSPIQKNYSAEQYAEEARLLLDGLGINKVIYIAHSYGAHVARMFAAHYPDYVASLMLIEPASEHDVDIMRQIDLAQAEREIAAVKLQDLENGMSNQYLDFWSKRPLPDYPEVADIPVTVIASVKRYEEPPVLLFNDQGRKLWGQLHKDWAEAFPQGRAVLTEQSYHFPQHDEPEMVIAEIKALVARTLSN